jgi:hypothetical protein
VGFLGDDNEFTNTSLKIESISSVWQGQKSTQYHSYGWESSKKRSSQSGRSKLKEEALYNSVSRNC